MAVRTLTDEVHAGQAYALTGPEAVPQAAQARLIGEAIGRPVRFEEQSEAQARKELLPVFGDPALVDASLAYWRGLVVEPEPATTTVAEVTGRPARTFAQWARDHAADSPLGVDRRWTVVAQRVVDARLTAAQWAGSRPHSTSHAAFTLAPYSRWS